MKLIVLKILLLCPLLTQQSIDPVGYIGAVVEYSPLTRPKNGTSAVDLNTENYLKFIDMASQYAVDILVFPESSLSISSSKNKTIARSEAASYIPNPAEKIIPCNHTGGRYSYSLRRLSCAASQYKMYVVINHREKVDCVCENCPSDGLLIYNTNVAFDRTGAVVARYRKYNLFGERGTNVTSEPNLSYFATDFNVTFGQFICFDLLFQIPTLNLTRDLGITDIIFSAHWFSELPHLFSAQAQAAWAYANDVNLLAAGHNNPRTASGGSGIYIGRYGYTQVVTEKKESNLLLISKVPKFKNGKRLQSIDPSHFHKIEFKRSEMGLSEDKSTRNYEHVVTDISPYTTELIDPNEKIRKTLCNRGLCCSFKLDMNFDHKLIEQDNVNYYRYRMAVFNGVRTFSGQATGGIKTCGIISCVNETIEGCAQLFDSSVKVVWPTEFKDIAISTTILEDKNVFFMPVTLTPEMIPLNASDFIYESYKSSDNTGENFTNCDLKIIRRKRHLLTFSIFGRNFGVDGLEVTRSYSPSSSLTLLLPLGALLFTLLNPWFFRNEEFI